MTPLTQTLTGRAWGRDLTRCLVELAVRFAHHREGPDGSFALMLCRVIDIGIRIDERDLEGLQP